MTSLSLRFAFGIDASSPYLLNLGLWLLKSFFKEAVVWKRLRHPNVVPFLGVTNEPLQLVSEWMPNGTLAYYVKKNPNADRIALVSLFPQLELTSTDGVPSY